MNEVGVVLSYQGKYKEAEAVHRQTLQLRSSTFYKRACTGFQKILGLNCHYHLLFKRIIVGISNILRKYGTKHAQCTIGDSGGPWGCATCYGGHLHGREEGK
jgi:hypothetical protein